MTFYISHRHGVCLVDLVDLIYSLYSQWEGFGSSSLITLPLGFNCGFISTSLGRPLGFASEAALEDLGLSQRGPVAEVVQLLGLQGFWQHQVAQGSWWLGQQEIQCSRRVWHPVLANTLQYSCLENPFPDGEAWQVIV